MSHSKLTVRPGTEDDLQAINDIYNQYVKETHFTFDVEPITIEVRREWFTHYGPAGRYRLLVSEAGDRVVGFACSSRYRPKPAYEASVETTIYLAPDAVGRGAGSKLYDELFKTLEGEDIHRAYAGVSLPNPASIVLHERCGFKRVAHFRAASSSATGMSPGSRSRSAANLGMRPMNDVDSGVSVRRLCSNGSTTCKALGLESIARMVG
jgi:phosphinothricin acetyltransferase